jgi:hypothetical protein
MPHYMIRLGRRRIEKTHGHMPAHACVVSMTCPRSYAKPNVATTRSQSTNVSRRMISTLLLMLCQQNIRPNLNVGRASNNNENDEDDDAREIRNKSNYRLCTHLVLSLSRITMAAVDGRKYIKKYQKRDPDKPIRAPVVPCRQRLRAAAVAANAGIVLTGPRSSKGSDSNSAARKRKLDTSWTLPTNRKQIDTFVPQNIVVRGVACANIGTYASLTDGRADRRVYPAITINVHEPRVAMTISTIKVSSEGQKPVVKINVTGASSYMDAWVAMEQFKIRLMRFPHRYFTPDEIRRCVHLERNVCSRFMVNMCCTARLSFPVDMKKFEHEHPGDGVLGALNGKINKTRRRRKRKTKKQKTEEGGGGDEDESDFPGAFWDIHPRVSSNGGDRGYHDAKHHNLAVVFGGSEKDPKATASMNLLGMVTLQSVEDASRFIPDYMKRYERKRTIKVEED